MSNVAALAARFRGKAPLKNPMQFEMDKRAEQRKQAREVQLARQKAAAYNMTLRALAIQASLRGKRTEEQDRKARAEARRRAARFRMTMAIMPLKKDSPEEKKAKAHYQMLANLAVGGAYDEDDRLSTVPELKSARASHRSHASVQSIAAQEEIKAEAEKELNRQALLSFMRENCPERLDEIEDLLTEFKGREHVLFQELSAKLNEDLAKAEAEKKAALLESEDPEDHIELQKAREEAKMTEVEILEKAAKESEETKEAQEEVVETRKESIASVASRKASEIVKRLSLGRKKSSNAEESSVGSEQDDLVSDLPGEPEEETVQFGLPGGVLLDKGLELKDVITLFYQTYAPEKTGDVGAVLAHFEGREQDLFSTLEIKYDVTFSPDGSARPNGLSPVTSPKQSKTSRSTSVASAVSKVELEDEPSPTNTPFIEAAPVVKPKSKFAVDVQSRVLESARRTSKTNPELVKKAVMDSTGPMM